MKFSLIITIFFTLLNSGYSQDYSIVKQGGQFSYKIYQPQIKSDTMLATIVIDSVLKKTFAVEYFNFKSPETKYNPKIYDQCTVIDGPSWIGKKIIAGKDTSFIISIRNDSLLFLTNASLYESWILYKFKKDTLIEAVVSSIDFLPVVGNIFDTVKTITLTVKNSQNFGINHPANNRSFKLSKNYGFITAFDWRYFPDSLHNEFKICGIPNPMTGIKPITFRQVFDYDIGDEFHYSEGDTDEAQYGNISENIIRVIDKQIIDSNTWEYTYANFIKYINLNGYKSDTSYKYREASERINVGDYPLFEPEESTIGMINYAGIPLIDFLVTINKYGGRQVIYNDFAYYQNQDSCYREINRVYDRIYEYVEGCGAYYVENFGYGFVWKKLHYYNKNGKTWGTPLDVPTSVNTLNNFKDYLYFDQLTSRLVLTLPHAGVINLRVTDLSGSDVVSPIINESNSCDYRILDLSNQSLNQGIYFAILSFEGEIIPFKFAVLH